MRVAHEVAHLVLCQEVKDVRPFVHPAGPQRTLALAEIKQVQVLEWHVVEVEVALKLHDLLHGLAESAAEDAAAGQGVRQPPEAPEPVKGRILRVVNEVAPVVVFIRPSSRQNRWNAGRTVAKDRVEPFADGQQVVAKPVAGEYLKPHGVDHDE